MRTTDWTDTLNKKGMKKFYKGFVQGCIASKTLILRYARDKQGKPYGVIVGVKTPSGIRVGYSKCNRKLDNWNRYEGIYYAVQRAYGNGKDFAVEDKNFTYWVSLMQKRAEKYWKVSPSIV